VRQGVNVQNRFPPSSPRLASDLARSRPPNKGRNPLAESRLAAPV